MRFALLVAYFSLLALVGAGCSVVYPGNQLVIVDVDPELRRMFVPVVDPDDPSAVVEMPLSAYAEWGIRYWDVLGARLRTPDQLVPEEEHLASTAPHVPVRASAEREGTTLGWYSNEGGYVHLCYGTILALSNVTSAAMLSLVAHEFGHAMGLGHVPEGTGIMSPVLVAATGISQADAREWEALWGKAR